MSFTDKIGSLMARPNEDLVSKDDISPWMKYAARGLGAAGGGLAIFLGIWAASNIILANVSCLFGGVMQMLAGFLIIVIEAPCCCIFLDFVSTVAEFADKRPYWNRGALYIVIALPPIILCPGVSTILGSGLIFATGVLYGLMAVGKKAPLEQMQSNAAGTGVAVGGSAPSSGMKSSLVDNAQPIAFTGGVDSNV